MKRQYWLFKSEPTTFSIDALRKSPKQTSYWDGVRNFQARNFLRDSVKDGDGVLFYHSNTEPIGIAGEAVVVISLRRLEKISNLQKMWVLRRGMRLSIQPVTEDEWNAIVRLPEWS